MKRLFILLFTLAAILPAETKDTTCLSFLEPVPPFPELRKTANADRIPLDGFSSTTHNRSLAPEDSVTALITLHQKRNRRTQWLVYFEVIATTNRPSARPRKPVVLYNSMGDKFEFPSSPVTFRIRTVGPYVDTASLWGAPVSKENYGRATVNETFLSLGLDKSAAAMFRINADFLKTQATNINVRASGHPPSAAEIQTNQALAEALHITPEEKRALATWMPSLMAYFNAVGETPDLEGILWKVVRLPSVWSIVRHAGFTVWIGMDTDDIRPVSLPLGWNAPGHRLAYEMPLAVRLNQRPALDVTLIVTDPRPSLLACGGIIGFLAQNPNDEENYLTLRILSARNGIAKEKVWLTGKKGLPVRNYPIPKAN